MCSGSIKNLLKGFSLIGLMNAWIKSRRVKRGYEQTKRYYELKDKAPLPQHPLLSVKKVRGNGVPFGVFFLGTDEYQDRSGILQALERLSDLTWFTRADGAYGQNFPGSEEERRRTNSDRVLALFKDVAEVGKAPDILLAQTWAGYIDPKVLGRIRAQYGTIIVNIAMDDRHQYWGNKVDGEWRGTRGLIPYLDLALTAAPECVEWYQKEGCPALFFPEASDPNIFYPMPELPKTYDVCFVGGRYGVREKIVKTLREGGVQVTTYGHGWEHGRLDTKEVPRVFAQSKIVLGVGTIGYCKDFYSLKMRDFDGPMSGSLYLTHDNSDLRDLYEVGKEIDTYTSAIDCLQKVRHYLNDADARERLAAAGRERAIRDHTWDRRFSDLFGLLTGTTADRHGQARSYES